MPPFRPGDGLPDFGAAVGALIDKVDLRHAPMGLDLPDKHGKYSHAAGAQDRSGFGFVMLNVGWHVGSPFNRGHGEPQPAGNLPADGGCPSSTLSNVRRTNVDCPVVLHSCDILIPQTPLDPLL